MMRKPLQVTVAILVAAATGTVGVSTVEGQHTWWNERGPPDTPAEEFYENIRVMIGVPAAQIRPTMSLIETTLGVHCTYCHAAGDFAVDTPRKEVARRMMLMVRRINESEFEGRNVVTCATCHAGSPKPALFPPVGGGRDMHSLIAKIGSLGEEVPLVGAAPSPDDLLDRYLAALGGRETVDAITSLAGTGVFIDYGHVDVAGDHRTRTPVNPVPVPLRFVTSDQDKRAVIAQLERGDLAMVHQGGTGWAVGGFFGPPDAPPRDMVGDELDVSRLQNAALFPMQFRELLQDMRVTGTAMVGGQPATVVTGRTDALPVVKLFFWQDSGLLANIQYWMENPFCCRRALNLFLTDHTDLLAFGARVPRRWILVSDRDLFHEYRLDSLEINVPVDDGIFLQP